MLKNTNCLLAINNYYYRRGGAEVLFLEHNRMFENIGWQVVPFAMRHPKNLATPWSDYFPDEIEFGENYGLGAKVVRAPRVIYSMQARRQHAQPAGQCPAADRARSQHLSPSVAVGSAAAEGARNSGGDDSCTISSSHVPPTR